MYVNCDLELEELLLGHACFATVLEIIHIYIYIVNRMPFQFDYHDKLAHHYAFSLKYKLSIFYMFCPLAFFFQPKSLLKLN